MFWLNNKENNFQLHTLIWGPELASCEPVNCDKKMENIINIYRPAINFLPLGNFSCFFVVCWFFFKINFFEKFFQERHLSVKQIGSRENVGPDLGPICLQMLSDYTRRQRVNQSRKQFKFFISGKTIGSTSLHKIVFNHEIKSFDNRFYYIIYK